MSYSPWANQFLSKMLVLVSIETYLGVSGNGTRQYGPAKTYHCYINAVGEYIRNAQGAQIRSRATLYVHPLALDGTVLTALNEDARLTLATGTVRQPVLVKADSLVDRSGLITVWVLQT